MDFNIVLYDGDVEWQEVTEDNITYYVAPFTPQNPFSPYGTVILTLNGTDIEGQENDGMYVFPDFDSPIAMIQLGDGDDYMLVSMNEADAHITIIQNFNFVTLYQGTVTVTDHSGISRYGEFSANASFREGIPVKGTINGVQVYGTVDAYNVVDFSTADQYKIEDQTNESFRFYSQTLGEYTLDLEYVQYTNE